MAEKIRLKSTINNHGWKKWGPYLSERQWGTVREDYSENGDAWNYLPHDVARCRAYRWGEDGIGGISDNRQYLCFALSFWNGKDSILKERLYGLSNGEGNHGEDVKEYYYYLDSTPTHSYMKMLYKYPQNAFPYAELSQKNAERSKKEREYELIDTGIFDNNAYFDIFVSYAKKGEEDIFIDVTIENRAEEKADLHLLPTLWFRNTWSWGYDDYKPSIYSQKGYPIFTDHRRIGNYRLHYEDNPALLFCDNDTNPAHFEKAVPKNTFYKDGIHRYVVEGDEKAVNKALRGTKVGLHYKVSVPGKGKRVLRFRLTRQTVSAPFADFDETFRQRKTEADAFYHQIQRHIKDQDLRKIQRQAYAGMLWNKQFYYYNVNQWLEGDPGSEPPPNARKQTRNHRWRHLVNANIISMPDKWEYPWYAAWDLAFHCTTIVKIDPKFAKRQLLLLLREYYMHPNGQIPAYEWSFSDVNPPVHAWGAWQVYSIEKEMQNGIGDTDFLARIFLKLTMNFTWWVNQKDHNENNLFEGGFLGLDNIGVFDRSDPPLQGNQSIEQADGTAWMAMYSLNMLRMAIELSKVKPYYQEAASKFFEHFLMIAGSLTKIGTDKNSLWDKEDEFYYDVLHTPGQADKLLKVRSLVGLLPLLAVEVFDANLLKNNHDFTRRLEHALATRPDLARLISRWFEVGSEETRLLALVRTHRMKCLLKRMLDEEEFLSDYGIRALSKYHLENPYELQDGNQTYKVTYLPGESDSAMFGGNSNWRGPIWFPVNFLLIEALHKFYEFYGDNEKIEYPTGSKNYFTLKEIALKITYRLIKIFKKDEDGKRTVFGKKRKFQEDPHFKDHILFYEYFHGDSGEGLGASHQTGWTGLIVNLIDRYATNSEY